MCECVCVRGCVCVYICKTTSAGLIQEKDDIAQLLCILQGNDEGMKMVHDSSIAMVSCSI